MRRHITEAKAMLFLVIGIVFALLGGLGIAEHVEILNWIDVPASDPIWLAMSLVFIIFGLFAAEMGRRIWRDSLS